MLLLLYSYSSESNNSTIMNASGYEPTAIVLFLLLVHVLNQQ